MDEIAPLKTALADRYEVEREIGRGGMATVYLARDLRHGRPVALKVLDPELGALIGSERFLAEIRVTANLQHPNLLPLFDSGSVDGRLFYVMPYVDGESLRARMDREKQLPVDDAVHIAIAVAEALDYAHRHGIIHRDLKPENILLQDAHPVVADFGIALAVSNSGGSRITQTGLSLGTPQYMSPEQATGDRTLDGRTDIYSLGAVLYEMLAGEPPHVGGTAQAVIARVLTEKPRPIRATRPTVAHHIEHAIGRALAKLPADRWPSAQEFARALAGEYRLAASAEARESSIDGSLSARRRTRRFESAFPWVLALVGLAAGAAIATWVARPEQPRETPVRFVLTLEPGERVIDSQGSPIALSPDGRLLAYSGEKNGVRAILVRPLSDLHSRVLQGTESGRGPFFSPDGQWIGYYDGTQLRKVPVNGGTSVTIASLSGVWGAHWYKPDEIVVSAQGKLGVVHAAGGDPRWFATRDSASADVLLRRAKRFPFVLSDGKTVLFTAFGDNGLGNARIGVVSLGGGKARLLDLAGTAPVAVLEGRLIYASGAGAIMAVPFDERRVELLGPPETVIDGVVVGPSGPLKGAVSASGSVVYFSGSSAQQIVVAESGRPSQVLLGQPAIYGNPRWSPDGKQFAVEIGTSRDKSIHVFDIPSSTLTRLTSGPNDGNPEWSPDGKRLLFISYQADRTALWWQPVDQSAPAEILYQPKSERVGEGMLANDGGLVVRLDGGATPNDLWFRAARDTIARPLIATPAAEVAPRVSPDSKWVAYSSDESGRHQVYVTPLPGSGARVQVSANGGMQPVWSPDGKRLFYVANGSLVAASLAFEPGVRVTSRDTLFTAMRTGPPLHASYDVARDGKRFLLVQNVGAETQLVVVHNWKDELRNTAKTSR